MPSYYSWHPDPFGRGVNAFSHSRDHQYGYALPPFNQISRVLYKLCSHQLCTILLIFLYWPSQQWFPSLSSYFVDIPLLVPSSCSLLSCQWKPEMTHPLLPHLNLVACTLSANSYLQEKLHQHLSTSYLPAGRKPHRNTTL